MTNEELIARLRDLAHKMFQSGNWGCDLDTTKVAADRTEELVKERDDWKAASQGGFRANIAVLKRLQAAEARATRLEAERDAAWKRAEYAEKMWGEALTKKQEVRE